MAGALGLVVVPGCADKAPEPKWPEPPPPTLAEPIGQEAAAGDKPGTQPVESEEPGNPQRSATDAPGPAAGAAGDEPEPAPEPNEPEDGAVRIDR